MGNKNPLLNCINNQLFSIQAEEQPQVATTIKCLSPKEIKALVRP